MTIVVVDYEYHYSTFFDLLMNKSFYFDQGQSITPFKTRTYPIVYAGDVEIPGKTINTTKGFKLSFLFSYPYFLVQFQLYL